MLPASASVFPWYKGNEIGPVKRAKNLFVASILAKVPPSFSSSELLNVISETKRHRMARKTVPKSLPFQGALYVLGRESEVAWPRSKTSRYPCSPQTHTMAVDISQYLPSYVRDLVAILPWQLNDHPSIAHPQIISSTPPSLWCKINHFKGALSCSFYFFSDYLGTETLCFLRKVVDCGTPGS